jgi:hypothetical protein
MGARGAGAGSAGLAGTGLGAPRAGGGAATSRRSTALSAAWRAACGVSEVAVNGFEITAIPRWGRRGALGIITIQTPLARNDSPTARYNAVIAAAFLWQ